MTILPRILLGCALLALAGCHSAFVEADVVNRSGAPIRLFELDYPSASFGSSDLAPGATFHSRFKVLGSGPTKLTWTDAGEHEHTAQGPPLHEGQQGRLTVEIGPATAQWTPDLQAGHP